MKRAGTNQTNLEACQQRLRRAGFLVFAFLLCPTLFTKPVLRARVWMIILPMSLCQFLSESELFAIAIRVMDGIVASAAQSEKELGLDYHLLSDSDPAIASALQRLSEKEVGQQPEEPPSKKVRWPDKHRQVCAERGVAWDELPASFSPAMFNMFPGLRALSNREVDILISRAVDLPSSSPGLIDLSQSADRSHFHAGRSSCVIPHFKALLTHRCRLVHGVEGLALQGIHFGSSQNLLRTFSSTLLMDLAGNAMDAHCCLASQVVALTLVGYCFAARQQHASAVQRAISPPQDASDDEDDFDSLWGM
jgi:hypothetical protein